jgi:hypothetical protein
LSEWSDEELVAEYRHIKDEVSYELSDHSDKQDASAGALESELRRRGLEPDREDVIPDAPNSGRGSSSTPSRGTAPDAGEESSG